MAYLKRQTITSCRNVILHEKRDILMTWPWPSITVSFGHQSMMVKITWPPQSAQQHIAGHLSDKWLQKSVTCTNDRPDSLDDHHFKLIRNFWHKWCNLLHQSINAAFTASLQHTAHWLSNASKYCSLSDNDVYMQKSPNNVSHCRRLLAKPSYLARLLLTFWIWFTYGWPWPLIVCYYTWKL